MPIRAAVRRALAALVGCAVACVAAIAPLTSGAVDRSLGADVPKPASQGEPWSVGAVSRLGSDLDAILADAPTLHGAHVGLLVLDTKSGAVLYARHADDAFQPASTFKLLTGSAALTILGAGHRFRTEALFDGDRLTIRGGGDPLLRATDLDALAQSLQAGGIRSIRGGVWVDPTLLDGAPYPPGWCWDDFPFDYAAVVSAATVEENVVHITVTPGAAPGAPVTIAVGPEFPERHMRPIEGTPGLGRAAVVRSQATTAPTDALDTLSLERDEFNAIVVTGELPAASAPETLDAAVPDAPWYLRSLVQRSLERAGIVAGRWAIVTGGGEPDPRRPASAQARVVWTHDGEPLSDLLADLWWPSDNLVAELLLRTLGLQHSGAPGTTEHGIDAERTWLRSIGVDPQTVTIADGSGLSAYDRVTPRALVAILQTDWAGPQRDLVLDDLPLAGVRGTLANSFLGTLAERRVFAKTGTVNHTRGLAGYLAPLHHGALTFAWSIDDWMGTPADLDALRARVLARLIGD